MKGLPGGTPVASFMVWGEAVKHVGGYVLADTNSQCDNNELFVYL
jgi:hypothetical protein